MSYKSLVFHIPHASRIILAKDRQKLMLSDTELYNEILQLTDHFTDELFNLPKGGVKRVLYPVSRLVVDPERFLDDASEPMADKGMGVIYTQTAYGKTLRANIDLEERTRLIKTYYKPHHQNLVSAVDSALAREGYCLIIDGHSFPDNPLPYEIDQNPDRPDICIGTDEFHTTEYLAGEVGRIFERAGFSVAFNHPFGGSIVPMKHYRITPAVKSIMIELNRKLYMNEATGEKLSDFENFCVRFQRCLKKIAQRFED